jgi:hypothetical protein
MFIGTIIVYPTYFFCSDLIMKLSLMRSLISPLVYQYTLEQKGAVYRIITSISLASKRVSDIFCPLVRCNFWVSSILLYARHVQFVYFFVTTHHWRSKNLRSYVAQVSRLARCRLDFVMNHCSIIIFLPNVNAIFSDSITIAKKKFSAFRTAWYLYW